ncbi:unnamed protein product [Lupinus luteus]|uniref:Uncharacterized protein n=1 Tax=Lupinus luteus TaxID=3873 RepID=A0AAV1XDB2_LUPLU
MSSPFHHRRSQSEVHFRIPADFHLQLDPFDSPSPEDAGDGTANASSNKTGRTGHRRSSSVDGSSSSLTEGIEDRRDTTGLSSENTELSVTGYGATSQILLVLRSYWEFLSTLEFWCFLKYYFIALNEALKKEVDRLKMATRETVTHANTYAFGMHQFSYSPTPFFSHQPQQWPGRLQARHTNAADASRIHSHLIWAGHKPCGFSKSDS